MPQLRVIVSGLLSGAKNLIAGACAGAVAATVVTPADVIKTRLQIESGDDRCGKSGMHTVAATIVKEEGPLALFKGLAPRLARIPVYTAVTLATFDSIKACFSGA